jgi:hypothetical protein
MNYKRKKLIISLPLVLAALLTTTVASSITTTPLAYGQAQTTAPAPPTTTTEKIKPEQMKALPAFQSAVATDPQFARYVQIGDMCMDRLFAGNATINPIQCETSLQQGADLWCGFESFDQIKCDYASQMSLAFKNFNRDMDSILGPGGSGNVPSGKELLEGLDGLLNSLPSSGR